jgi:triacylglycerol lipase
MTEYLKTFGSKKKADLSSSNATLKSFSQDEAAMRIQQVYKGHKQVKQLQAEKKKKTPHDLYLQQIGDDVAPTFTFNTRPGNNFSPLNAYWLARASFLVYYDEAVIMKEVLEEWKFDKCKFIDIHDTQVFVALNRKIRNVDGTYGKRAGELENNTGEDVDRQDLIIVSWRGTESRADIITDLTFSMVDGPFGQIHKGFKKAFFYAWQQVLDTIVDYCGGMEELNKDPDAGIDCRQTSIWLTGHSLGAALATLNAAYLFKDNIKVDGLYTYGQPRTGDAEFSQTLDKSYLLPRHYRFVNRADRVPRNPMRSFGFSHCGRLLYFDHGGSLYDTFALVRDADQHLHENGFGLLVGGDGKDMGAWKSKYDHSIGNYVKRMNKNLETVLLQVPMLSQAASETAIVIPEPRGPAPLFIPKMAPGIADTLRRSASNPKLHSPRHSPTNSPSPSRTGTPVDHKYLVGF